MRGVGDGRASKVRFARNIVPGRHESAAHDLDALILAEGVYYIIYRAFRE